MRGMTVAPTPDQAWMLLLALRRHVRALPSLPRRLGLSLDGDGQPLITPPTAPAPLLDIASDGTWSARTGLHQTSAELLDLYLPIALAHRDQPFTVAHLGQSLDGRIATTSGASRYVTGSENLDHLHRMRALCDALVIGANTVECDDPQLTTRRVPGPNPIRVVIDPRRRLAASHRLFHDGAALTLLICDEEWCGGETMPGHVELIGVPIVDSGLHLPELLRKLRERGLFSLFIEGGGITISSFLQQSLLDRLQITIAPFIMGSGRPSLTLPPLESLDCGLRPRHRRYVMGEDMLFDCWM